MNDARNDAFGNPLNVGDRIGHTIKGRGSWDEPVAVLCEVVGFKYGLVTVRVVASPDADKVGRELNLKPSQIAGPSACKTSQRHP